MFVLILGNLPVGSGIRIRFLKFQFAGSGSDRKWAGSATLEVHQQFVLGRIASLGLHRVTIDVPLGSGV